MVVSENDQFSEHPVVSGSYSLGECECECEGRRGLHHHKQDRGACGRTAQVFKPVFLLLAKAQAFTSVRLFLDLSNKNHTYFTEYS